MANGIRISPPSARYDSEQWGRVLQPARAIRRGGELDAVDYAQRAAAVVDGAADQIGNVGGARIERHALRQRNDNVLAGKFARACSMLSMPAKCRTMRPAFLPTGSQCEATRPARRRGRREPGAAILGEALWREPDLRMLGETLGKVGEQVCEDFASAPLGPKDVGQHDPLRSGFHE